MNKKHSPSHGQKAKKSPLMTALLVICILVFLGSGGYLLNEMVIKPYFIDKALDEIQTDLEDTGVSEGDVQEEITRADGTKETVTVNDTVKSVRKLRETYKELVGWIKIPNTDVHFPVMQSPASDPEYYLYRNYKGEDIKYGSIFLDSNGSIEGSNQILYGHSMLDGRMFYCLLDFADIEVYKKSPVIQYDTYEEAGKWKIVSVFKANTYYSQGDPFNYLQSEFGSDEEKMNYIYNCMIRSVINTGVDVVDTDRFITLSTCSYEYEGFRTVVVARKVRDGESEKVDVAKAQSNKNPLYPDVWYEDNGTEKPSYPLTFKEALEQGLTDWWYKGKE